MLLVLDLQFGEIPDSFDGRPFAHTSSCVAVGTKSADDGATLITFTDESVAANDLALLFCGSVSVPSKAISLANAYNEQLAYAHIDSDIARIEIWANAPREPSELLIRVSPSSGNGN